MRPPSFDHPGRIAFACRKADQLVPRAECDTAVREGRGAPFVLVTQVARGEVAVVDTLEQGVLDSDLSVPGYNFFGVGDLPVDIVVNEGRVVDVPRVDDMGAPVLDGDGKPIVDRTFPGPSFAYVAHEGSRDLWAIPLSCMIPGLAERCDESIIERLALPGRPGRLAFAPTPEASGRLYVSVPERGQVMRVALHEDGSLAATTTLTLPTSGQKVAETPADISAETSCQLCAATAPGAPGRVDCGGLVDPSTREKAQSSATTATVARPTELAVREGRLWVADAALPLVHRLDLTDAGETGLASFDVGVPLSALVVTPTVPAGNGYPSDEAYVYGVDATNGSVLVMNDQGAVLSVSVSPGVPADRLWFGAPARNLEVIARDDATMPSDCDAVSFQYNYLRGVHVAVATLNGGLHVVDVYDPSAHCGVAACMSGETEPGVQAPDTYFARHRRRIEEAFVSAVAAGIDGRLGGVASDLNEEGVFGRLGFGLAPVTCALGGAKVEDEFRLCFANDPWASLSGTVEAVYEGAVPGAAGGVGRVEGFDFFGEVSFCGLGVVGANLSDAGGAALPADAPEAALTGDALWITGPSPIDPSAASCDGLLTAAGVFAPVRLAIAQSFNDRLTLASSDGDATTLKAKAADGRDVPLCQVRACLSGLTTEQVCGASAAATELLTYEVRASDSWVVTSDLPQGGLHRVVRVDDTESAACVVDTALPETWQSRAVADSRFDDGLVAFVLTEAAEPPIAGSTLHVEFANVNDFMGKDMGTLPSHIAFNGFRLFAVDGALQQLRQYLLFPFEETERFQ